jgi:rhamnosyltransferase
MDASIIILTKNAGGNFKTLLQRIFSQEFSGRYEVVIIESGSSDNTLSIADEFPVRITRIKPEEFHHGRTRNLGAELANGKILVYITQDALPLGNDWLQKLTDNFIDPDVDMVCGRQIAWESTKPPEKFFYAYNFPDQRLEVKLGAADYYRDNIFISNVNSAIRKEIWQQFKFSEKVLLAEDKELARRLLFAGWRIIYTPEAAVYHAHDLSLRAAFQKGVEFGIAASQGAGGLPRSKNWIAQRLVYLMEEARYMANTDKWWKWLPYSMAYEASKLLGIGVGWLRGKFSKTIHLF